MKMHSLIFLWLFVITGVLTVSDNENKQLAIDRRENGVSDAELQERNAELMGGLDNLTLALTETLQQVQGAIVKLESRIGDVELTLDSVISNVTDLQSQRDGIGFTAQVARDVYKRYNQDEIIKFGRETGKLGDHYDTGTGQFTCPFDGTYAFMLSVVSDPTHNSLLVIVKDGERFAPTENSDPQPRSHLAVMRCNAGQQVYVIITESVAGTYKLQYSMFSGFLINAK